MKPWGAVAAGAGAMAVLAAAAFWLEKTWPTRPQAHPDNSLAQAQPSDNSPQSSAIFAISLPDAAGKPTQLGSFSGKWVVINFWATWCAPCREEMPVFVRLQREWQARNVQFVGISVDRADKVAQFSNKIGVNYPLLLAPDNGIDLSRSMGNRLGVLPHTLVLAPDGRTVLNRAGPVTEDMLTALFSANFAEKATNKP